MRSFPTQWRPSTRRWRNVNIVWQPSDGGVTHPVIARSADLLLPSDDATATFAIAATYLLHGMRRIELGFLAAAVLVSFSHVYVGTRYASEVLGAAVTSATAALIVRAAYRKDPRLDRFIIDFQ